MMNSWPLLQVLCPAVSMQLALPRQGSRLGHWPVVPGRPDLQLCNSSLNQTRGAQPAPRQFGVDYATCIDVNRGGVFQPAPLTQSELDELSCQGVKTTLDGASGGRVEKNIISSSTKFPAALARCMKHFSQPRNATTSVLTRSKSRRNI